MMKNQSGEMFLSFLLVGHGWIAGFIASRGGRANDHAHGAGVQVDGPKVGTIQCGALDEKNAQLHDQ